MTGRQKAAAETVESAGRDQSAVEHDEAGKVLAFAAEPVVDPGAHARASLQCAAGVQEVIREGVFGKTGSHRTHDGQFIHALGDVGKQVTYRNAGCAVILKLPRTGKHLAVVVELRGFDLKQLTRILAVILVQHRLGIEGVDL